MSNFLPAIWGGSLLTVVLALGELSTPVATLLCAIGQHCWRSAARSPRLRCCECCRRLERAADSHPRPWGWNEA